MSSAIGSAFAPSRATRLELRHVAARSRVASLRDAAEPLSSQKAEFLRGSAPSLAVRVPARTFAPPASDRGYRTRVASKALDEPPIAETSSVVETKAEDVALVATVSGGQCGPPAPVPGVLGAAGALSSTISGAAEPDGPPLPLAPPVGVALGPPWSTREGNTGTAAAAPRRPVGAGGRNIARITTTGWYPAAHSRYRSGCGVPHPRPGAGSSHAGTGRAARGFGGGGPARRVIDARRRSSGPARCSQASEGSEAWARAAKMLLPLVGMGILAGGAMYGMSHKEALAAVLQHFTDVVDDW